MRVVELVLRKIDRVLFEVVERKLICYGGMLGLDFYRSFLRIFYRNIYCFIRDVRRSVCHEIRMVAWEGGGGGSYIIKKFKIRSSFDHDYDGENHSTNYKILQAF